MKKKSLYYFRFFNADKLLVFLFILAVAISLAGISCGYNVYRSHFSSVAAANFEFVFAKYSIISLVFMVFCALSPFGGVLSILLYAVNFVVAFYGIIAYTYSVNAVPLGIVQTLIFAFVLILYVLALSFFSAVSIRFSFRSMLANYSNSLNNSRFLVITIAVSLVVLFLLNIFIFILANRFVYLI